MHHDLGLGHLGRTYSANGAAAPNLPQSDGRGLVVLAMAPQLGWLVAVVVRDDVHVVVEGVEVYHEAGRVQFLHWRAGQGRLAVNHLVAPIRFWVSNGRVFVKEPCGPGGIKLGEPSAGGERPVTHQLAVSDRPDVVVLVNRSRQLEGS